MALRLVNQAAPMPSERIKLLNEKQFADILGISPRVLQQDRYLAKQAGVPPRYPYVKLPSGGIRYRESDVAQIIVAGLVSGDPA